MPERATALISCAPSGSSGARGTFRYAGRSDLSAVDQGRGRSVKAFFGLADSVSSWWSLLLAPPTSARCFPPGAVLFLELVLLPCPGGASISLTSSARRGFPSWVPRRRDAKGRLQVRVAALACLPRLPTKRGYGGAEL